MTHPYQIEADDRKLTITTPDGDFLGPFEVHYDGSSTAAGVRVYEDGLLVTTRVLAQPSKT
jgi:hypothetical protein